jgi:pimeloyl-ACP methyl ester carboxylesterase
MTDLAWEQGGQGERTLLLLHPGIGDASFWDPLWERLGDLGRIVRFDARGFGASPDPDEAFSPAADALAVLDAAGAERAIVVGVSYGSAIALDLALAHPDRVEGLVLVSGPGYAADAPLREALLEVDAAMEEGDLATANEREIAIWAGAAPEEVQTWMRGLNGPLLERQSTFEHEPEWLVGEPAKDRLDALDVPLLILLGERDQPSTIASARRVAALAGAGVVMVPDAGHLLGREQPDAFVEALRGFVEEL